MKTGWVIKVKNTYYGDDGNFSKDINNSSIYRTREEARSYKLEGDKIVKVKIIIQEIK